MVRSVNYAFESCSEMCNPCSTSHIIVSADQINGCIGKICYKACDHLSTSLDMSAAVNSPTNPTSIVQGWSFLSIICLHSQLPELLKWHPYPYSLHFSSKGLRHEAGCEAVLGRVGSRGVRTGVVGEWEHGRGIGLEEEQEKETLEEISNT